jgi:NAD(P)-dependent dehydrogenase (short-subunit alcohol dehydrogenase family)
MGAKPLTSSNPKDFASVVQLDLQSDDSIAAGTTYLTETYDHIDALVNNVGVLLDHANLNSVPIVRYHLFHKRGWHSLPDGVPVTSASIGVDCQLSL